MPHLKGPVPQVQAKEGPMPQLVKKRRSGWAVLAAGALVASLFAVGASPAAAIDEDSEQDHKATSMTACLGDAVADQGFTDLGTLDFAGDANINCLAYYGISAGRTADTFDPNSNVTRRHMALFLYAAAGLMGVDLMEGDMMVDFGDISELGEDMQNAITALARNGILSGRSDMAFEPFADITRAEMAVALVNLLDQTPGAPVHKNKAGAVHTRRPILRPLSCPMTASMTPMRLSRSRLTTPSARPTSWASPAGDRSREHVQSERDCLLGRNMATFIANALDHSNVRPAGLTAQVMPTARSPPRCVTPTSHRSSTRRSTPSGPRLPSRTRPSRTTAPAAAVRLWSTAPPSARSTGLTR